MGKAGPYWARMKYSQPDFYTPSGCCFLFPLVKREFCWREWLPPRPRQLAGSVGALSLVLASAFQTLPRRGKLCSPTLKEPERC